MSIETHACTPVRGASPWQESCLGASELRRAAGYPISRWYLRPAAGWMAALLAPTRVRPVQLTLCGLAAAMAATMVLLTRPEGAPWAAALVLAYWFFDRADGQLARRQQSVSPLGAWLDANVDEAADVALHVAVAVLLARQTEAVWPWWLLAAFLAGKYLLMYGLAVEEHAACAAEKPPDCCPGDAESAIRPSPANAVAGLFHVSPAANAIMGVFNASRQRGCAAALRRLYHLPGNADVRIHLLAAALATGWLAAELAFVAAYYNFRWIVRYGLVARRLGGAR